MATALPRPGPVHGPYPQQDRTASSPWRDLADAIGDALTTPGTHARGRVARFRAAQARAACRPADAPAAAHRLSREGFSADAIADGLQVAAGCIEAATGLRPYASQHLAAFHLLDGRLVELDTGEGKSLAILLAATTAALARVPTHVITANEYLATRDAQAAHAVLERLGLRAAAIRADMDTDQRRAAYACDVVYATAQEIGFDYLRDRERHQQPGTRVLRGLCLALVDEADSVLLDHARTPLVLAAADDGTPPPAAEAAWRFSASLAAGRDYHLHEGERRIDLLPGALLRLPAALARLGRSQQQAALLRDALMARHALLRDVHYLVDGAEVVLLDRNTGRRLPGTVWSRGVQAMVHLKEGLLPPKATRTTLQITLQTLLRRYLHLAGLSGTLRESRGALWFFYRLRVTRVAPRLPSRRLDLGTRLFVDRAGQQAAVARRAAAMATSGRAVLVGTDTLAAADRLSHALTRQKVPHHQLTARDDADEAERVAAAGHPGSITVATHVAGRGTDIALAEPTLRAGGLHVVCCAQNPTRRIDRQLAGRAARNGRPGSSEFILSLEDPAYSALLPSILISVLRHTADTEGVLPQWAARAVPWLARTTATWNDFLASYHLVRHDHRLRAALTFAPRPE